MGKDKLSEYLREFILESKGRNALIYEEASKLVRMLRNAFANKEIPDRGFYFELVGHKKELVDFLRPYLPFRFNIQDKHDFEFSVHKFDSDGNVIELNYYFMGKWDIIKLKKPLDLFGYYLNKKNKDFYEILAYYPQMYLRFMDKEFQDFSKYFTDLIKKTENTGDELGRDDLKYREGHDPNKSYKYCWDEDYVDEETNEVKTLRKCEYKLPSSKRFSYSSKEI